MACECSTFDWSGVDLGLNHHPDCKENAVGIAPSMPGERECEDTCFVALASGETFEVNLRPVLAWLKERGGILKTEELRDGDVIRFWPTKGSDVIHYHRTAAIWSAPTTEDISPDGGLRVIASAKHLAGLRGPYVQPNPLLDELLVNGARLSELEKSEQEVAYLREWRDRLFAAIPYWMGFLSSDDFLAGLVAWIKAHRWSSRDHQVEQSWRLQFERAIDLEAKLRDANQTIFELQTKLHEKEAERDNA
jgi:hypothetical protein